MTTTDSNGIIRFQASDPLNPLQVTLNAMLTSVSNAFTSDRNSLTELENLIITETIPGSADLNAYVDQGVFAQRTNANAASGTNYPVGAAGFLQVFRSGSLVTHLYYVNGSSGGGTTGEIYIRTSLTTGVSWIPWRKILMDDDTGWINFTGTYASGWTPFTAGDWDGVKYRRRNGIVYLQGAVQKSSAPNIDELIFTMPSGFRPSHHILGMRTSSVAMYALTIGTNGQVRNADSQNDAGTAAFSFSATYPVD